MSPNDEKVKAVERNVRAMLKTLPRLVGNEVVNFSKDNFRRQGFLGDTFEPWPKRKAKNAPRNNGRGILIDTGKLRRATRVVSADWNEVRVGNDVPYAKAHNEGLRLGLMQNVRAHRRKVPKKNKRKVSSGITFVKAHKRKVNMKMPRRRFLGSSQYLTRNIHRLIASKIQKALS